MTTIDLTDYPPIDKEFLFFSIKETLWGKYIVRFNSNNELTVYLKDEFRDCLFPQFLNDENVKFMYCILESREEMLEYIQILTDGSLKDLKD
jgi:hypothetical protein